MVRCAVPEVEERDRIVATSLGVYRFDGQQWSPVQTGAHVTSNAHPRTPSMSQTFSLVRAVVAAVAKRIVVEVKRRQAPHYVPLAD